MLRNILFFIFTILLLHPPQALAIAANNPIFNPEEHSKRLPPSPQWQGKGLRFVKKASDKWVTPSEKSDFKDTAEISEIKDYLKKLESKSRHLKLISLGKVTGNHEMLMMIASQSTDKTPKGLYKSKKPTVLLVAGIHPGESMGIDAGMMFMRELAMGKEYSTLLAKANVLFIPLHSIVGHTRRSEYGRMNQTGPNKKGWRSNEQNRNLNRDFSKLDAYENRLVVNVMTQWNPHLYIDSHSTDGMNYQYDITWNHNSGSGWSPNGDKWLKNTLTPYLLKAIAKEGHIPGPCIDALDPLHPEKGYFAYYNEGAKYSNSYADTRQIPSYLLEAHSLKPYRQRVVGSLVFFAEVTRAAGNEGINLINLVKKDKELRPKKIVADWKENTNTAPLVNFKGFKYNKIDSAIAGKKVMQWTDQPVTWKVKEVTKSIPSIYLTRPKAFWIAPGWVDVIERIKAHGIKFTIFNKPVTKKFLLHKLEDVKVEDPFWEGRTLVNARIVPLKQNKTMPAGSLRIPTDQDLGILAMLLLDPNSPDSFFRMGFFNGVFSQEEYGEEYIMVPTAEAMIKKDQKLKAEFDTKLKNDRKFASDPEARLNWFYEKTPFYDSEYKMHPIAIEE